MLSNFPTISDFVFFHRYLHYCCCCYTVLACICLEIANAIALLRICGEGKKPPEYWLKGNLSYQITYS